MSPVKDKTKAKPKGKVAGAKSSNVEPRASKGAREEAPAAQKRSPSQRGAAGTVDQREGSREPRSTPKGASARARPGEGAASRAEKDENAGKTAAESNDDSAEAEEGDDEIVEAAGEVVAEEVKVDDIPKPSPSRGSALARLDPMQQYLREVQRHSLLTPEEEHNLAVKYVGTGDVAAAARLVTANLRLVVKLAYEYRRAYKNIMDLVQEGNIGLMQAVKRYDPYRGVKLSSYAAWWIRAYILRFILNNWRLVKLGTTQAQRKLFFNLNKEKARLSAMGIEPSAAEIARRLGVEEQEVTDMDRRLSSGEMSLDAPVGDTEGRPVSRLEMMPTSMAGPDTAVADGEIQQMVKAKLADFRTTLKGKDVQIFDDRLVAEDPLTLQELGDRFGISRERVRQLEARLTGRLREFLKSELGDAVAS
ncbi:MAG TPA: RNA polymerase factor sigma-32 [Polyangiaceae bacterium]|nr:RNA polymerase factor sigma-32 [Polyangiaceae bacterium]